MNTLLRRTTWVLIFIVAIIFSLTTLHYFSNGAPDQLQPDIYSDHLLILRLHIVLGILALLIGPLQFLAQFRNRYRSLHRNLGKVYIVSILFGSVGGLWLSRIAFGGLGAQLGFGVLAILWFGTTFTAYSKIRARNIQGHRDWMFRSYAITFAFVTFRLWYPFLYQVIGMPESTAYSAGAWLCWIGNLAVVECFLRRNKSESLAV